jgi:hypothetical protein
MEDKIYSIINYPDGSSYVKVKTLDEVFVTNSKYDEYYVSDHKGEPVQPDNLIINKMF